MAMDCARRSAAVDIIGQPQLWAGPDLPFVPISAAAADLALYVEQLLAWNKKLNLSASANARDLLADLVQDSFFLARFMEDICSRNGWKEPVTVDLGAGAGLPGIPLRLFWRQGCYTLVEARQKRALFLANMLARLDLPKTQLFEGRAEACLEMPGMNPDLVVSRAFMPWEQLLAFCGEAIGPKTEVVIMASEQPPALASEWKLLAKCQYDTGSKKRWLWSIGRS